MVNIGIIFAHMIHVFPQLQPLQPLRTFLTHGVLPIF